MANQTTKNKAGSDMPAVAQDEESLQRMAAEAPPVEETPEEDPLAILLAAEQKRVTEDILVPKRSGLSGDLRLTIGSLTDRQFRDISTEAEEVVRSANRNARRAGAAGKEINPDKFLRLIVSAGVVTPAFSHPQLLSKHQVHTGEEVVQAILLPGEIARVAELIMDLSGFNDNTIEFVGN